MGTVIGPFSQEDWTTLRMLKCSIGLFRQMGNPRYKKALDKETKIYNDLMSNYIKAA